jgi:hypothetical protein
MKWVTSLLLETCANGEPMLSFTAEEEQMRRTWNAKKRRYSMFRPRSDDRAAGDGRGLGYGRAHVSSAGRGAPFTF